MTKLIKKYMPTTKSMKNSKELKGLKSHLKSSDFWSYNQQSVARGIAAGLAGAVIPGFQFFYAAVLVILLRGNLPIALSCTLITNPLTVVPITYFIYYVGTIVIRNGHENFVVKSFQWDFSGFHAFWMNVSTWGLQFGKAFLVGLPIVSLGLGIAGYFGTILVWEGYVRLFKKKR